MTIRTRLNLWYSAVLCGVALTVGAAALYHEFFVEGHHHHHQEAEATLDSGDLVDILTWTLVPAVALGLAGGWWLTRRALAPVTELTQAVEKIHDHNLAEQLARTGNGDELDRLTEVFNAMTARLDGAFQRIREFTLHASHELKTPLTVLHGEIETELNGEQLSSAQREKRLGQLDEIQRLTRIVDGLTLLTKADAGQVKLKFTPLALDEIMNDVFADAQILARPANLSVWLAACEKISVNGDRHRLRQLLLNLTDNAVKYNQPGGEVEFSVRGDGTHAELNISNSGNGIPPEILPRVFERFFRGDAAHNSAVDGCGLGLSIAEWIVRAHHGEIRIASVKNRTTVTIRLPRASGKTIP
jgi:signal transduction histidine kinase